MIIVSFLVAFTLCAIKIKAMIEFFSYGISNTIEIEMGIQWIVIGLVVAVMVTASLTLLIKIVINLQANRTHDDVGHLIIFMMIIYEAFYIVMLFTFFSTKYIRQMEMIY